MSSTTLAGCQQRREFGLEKMKKKNWEGAIEDFQIIVKNLLADTDRKAALKMDSFNNMSLCFIQLDEYDKANLAAGESILIFDLMRPHTNFDEIEKHPRKNDPVFQQFHVSFVRRGQVYEKQKMYKEALEEYKKALKVNPKGEGNQKIQDLLITFGIQPVDVSDPKLKPFSQVAECMFDSNKIVDSFRDSIHILSEGKVTKETIQYLDENGITQLILGILNFHMENETVVDIALTITNFFIKHGAKRMWTNTDILISVLKQYHDNTTILTDLIIIFSSCPNDKYKSFNKPEVYQFLTEAFTLEIKDDELDIIFLFLFHILSSEKTAIDNFQDPKILEYILARKTFNGFVLLSRLSISDVFLNVMKTNGTLDWVFESLKEKSDISTYFDITIIILRQFLKSGASEGFNINEFADRCFNELTPLALKNTKNPKKLAEIINFLAQCLKYSPESCTKCNFINFVSANLAINKTEPELIIRSVEFLYECANDGLIPALKSSKIALKSVMDTLLRFPNNQFIVEYATSIAVLMGHEKKDQLLQAALMQFPNSTILNKYVDNLKKYAVNL